MAPKHSAYLMGLLRYGQALEDGMTVSELCNGGDHPYLAVRHSAAYEARSELMAAGYVVEEPRDERAVPAFGPALGLVLGVSVGTESLRAALIDANGRYLHKREADPNLSRWDGPCDDVLDEIAALARGVLTEAFDKGPLVSRGGRSVLPLLGVAVAWPFPVRRGQKHAMSSWLHPSWQDEPRGLDAKIARRFGLEDDRGHAINDANALAVSVAFDATRRPGPTAFRDRDDEVLLVVRVGGGLGAGTILIPKPQEKLPSETNEVFLRAGLLEGTNGMAGELGHLRISQHDIDEINARCEASGRAPLDPTWPCSCKSTNRHLEAFASGKALERRIATDAALEFGDIGLQDPGEREGRSWDILAALKDPRAIEMVRDQGRLIGKALASPILMLNPSEIWLTGSIAMVDALRAGIEEQRDFWRSEEPGAFLRTEIEGPDPEIHQLPDPYAAARGAALVVFRGHVFRAFAGAVKRSPSGTFPPLERLSIPYSTVAF